MTKFYGYSLPAQIHSFSNFQRCTLWFQFSYDLIEIPLSRSSLILFPTLTIALFKIYLISFISSASSQSKLNQIFFSFWQQCQILQIQSLMSGYLQEIVYYFNLSISWSISWRMDVLMCKSLQRLSCIFNDINSYILEQCFYSSGRYVLNIWNGTKSSG